MAGGVGSKAILATVPIREDLELKETEHKVGNVQKNMISKESHIN